MANDYLGTGRMFEGSTVSTLPESVVAKALMDAKDVAQAGRMLEAENRLAAYEDHWSELLEDRIKAIFTAENARELCKVIDTTNNPLKRIVNEASTLYSQPAAWSFKDKPTADTWRKILAGANADVVFPRINAMVTLLNTVLVYIVPYRDRLTFRLILPQDAIVVPDPNDPARPLEVLFREGGQYNPRATKERWHHYSRQGSVATYQAYDANGLPEGPKVVLPYRDEYDAPAIPICAYHHALPIGGRFWDDSSGDDLYELTIMMGLWETWTNHLIRTDSVQQKWASGQIVTGDQQGGSTTVLQFRDPDGNPVTVGQFNSQADWNGLAAQMKRKGDTVQNAYGVTLADTRTSGDPTSGFALMVRKEGMREIRARQVPLYRTWDKALYATARAVWNFEITNSAHPLLEGDPLPAPADAGLEIEYAPLDIPRTVDEQDKAFELAKKRMAMGFESPITIYLADHPGKTEDEARAAIEKNKKDTESLKPEPPPAPPQVPGMPNRPVDGTVPPEHEPEKQGG